MCSNQYTPRGLVQITAVLLLVFAVCGYPSTQFFQVSIQWAFYPQCHQSVLWSCGLCLPLCTERLQLTFVFLVLCCVSDCMIPRVLPTVNGFLASSYSIFGKVLFSNNTFSHPCVDYYAHDPKYCLVCIWMMTVCYPKLAYIKRGIMSVTSMMAVI
jgi:hypothetical protein